MRWKPEPKRLVAAFAIAMVVSACGSEDTPSFESAFGNEEPTPAPTGATETSSGEPAAAADAVPTNPPTEPPPSATPSLTPASIPEDLDLQLTPIVEIDRPIAMATRPGSQNLFVATKGGLVVEVEVTPENGGTLVRELIDIGDIIDDGFESGLLGLAFSPSGEHLYLSYSNLDHDNTVVEIQMAGDELDKTSGRTLLVVEQPRENHNGGAIVFGPDEMLYLAFGDGGGSGDPFDNGQDPETLYGTILRIDPSGKPYAIPADNPFATGGGAPEVFLYGVRNPWKFSFDSVTGDLWLADVGQDALEEINVLYASNAGGRGANLGWNDVEGTAPFAAPGPPRDDYAAPIFEYGRDEGCSVTGGYVYRGEIVGALAGAYVFGDYCSGAIWALASSETQGLVGRFELGLSAGDAGLASFGEGPDGELYVLSFGNVLYRIDPT